MDNRALVWSLRETGDYGRIEDCEGEETRVFVGASQKTAKDRAKPTVSAVMVGSAVHKTAQNSIRVHARRALE